LITGCIRRPKTEYERRLLKKRKYDMLNCCPSLRRKKGRGSGWFCAKYKCFVDPRYGYGLCKRTRVGL